MPDDATVAASWAWLAGRRRASRRRDPAVARALLDTLGLPDPPAVVHVVGTNGKGSVTTALAAMASAQGFRSGAFTSPHVERFEERIAYTRAPSERAAPVDGATVVAFTERARALVDARHGAPLAAGFFEWTLALALQAFADAGVEVAVIEAGVGARYDATTALGNVVASVVTNVDLDHLDTLGPDLLAIARDKVAAVRPGVPCVTGAVGAPLEVVTATARALGAPLEVVRSGSGQGLPGELAARAELERWPETRRDNLRIAAAVARTLGWSDAAIRAGADAPTLPARFERFEVGGVHVILDGAHDPAAAGRLARDLPPETVLVFAALARKQGAATLAAVEPSVRRVIVTSADEREAPGPWDADARLADPERALQTALAWAGPGGTVAIAGSLYLAGRLRGVLRSATTAASAG